MRVMLVTVGTGRDVEEGIAFSIDQAHPDRVYFLCSEQSAAKLPTIKRQLRQYDSPAELAEEPLAVSDPGDFDTTYANYHDAIGQIIAAGHASGDIIIDYTSGTKVMSAALVVAAGDYGIGRLVYIDGAQRAGEGMRVVSSTEQMRVSRAGSMYARRYLDLARSLFNRYQWAGAIELTEQATRVCRAGETANVANALSALAQCYQAWDQFAHPQASESARGITKHDEDLLGVDLSKNKSLLGRLERADEIEPKGEVGLALLADLVNNAERRASCGQYEDAVARLYRATELMSQIRLAALEPPIDSSHIPIERLPEGLREKWAHLPSAEGCVSSTLSMNYQLLRAVGDEWGEWFLHNKRLQNALKARNDAILAHGFRPVTADDYTRLAEQVLPQANKLDARISQWREAGQFVRLPET